MDTISEAAMASTIGTHGGTAVVHRYNSPEIEARYVSMARDLSLARNKQERRHCPQVLHIFVWMLLTGTTL
jgi:hypothetical protein